MADDRGQIFRHLPPGAATLHLKRLPSQSSGLRFPIEFCLEVGLTTLGQPVGT
jgi:hypothetical protein